MSHSEAEIEKEIQDKGLNAPRLTPAMIDAAIRSEHYFTAQDGVTTADPHGAQYSPKALDLLTFCVLVLRNGYTVTGESACASPENFKAEIGRKIAKDNARNKIWGLEGYLLRQNLYEQSQPGQSPE